MTTFAATVILGTVWATSARAQMYRPGTNYTGGVPAQSTITSVTPTGTNTTVCWYGMQGWYSVEAATNLAGPWNSVGRTVASAHANCFTVANPDRTNSYMFRLNQNNAYVGQGGCAGCHGDKYSEWQGTAHANAYSTIANLPPATRASCLPCHTVGNTQPTGFIDITNTPQLANVGCENCHGPAGWHKYSDHNLVRPAVSIDPAICGGCHQGEHHPTYEEYSESLHAQVNDDIKYGVAGGVYFSNAVPWFTSNLYGFYVTTNANLTLKTNATTGIIRSDYVPGSAVDNGRDRSSSCGVCHSGAARMAMLEDWEARLTGITNALTLPVAQDAAAWGPTCAVCHDPHSAENAKQLRNPMRSTNYFTMASLSDKRTVYTTNFMGATATNTAYYNSTFASLYDPNIQVCGQCHNTRGARWDGRAYGLITNGASITVGLTTNVTGYSRPPHHSPQYNILIGIVQPDYLTTNSLGVATNYTARHSGFTGSPYNTNQCATCHVPIYTAASGENITGHKFDLDKKGCNLAGCHLSGVPDVEGTQITTTNNLSRLADLLSSWATNKAPALLGPTAYNTSKQNSWEFTTPGALAGVTNAGPSTANQLKLPEAIRMARFNAYMVLHDGSLGVHNPGYLRFLLRDAETKVLSQLTVAKFQANSPSVFTNTAVTFTNLSVGPAACTWDFGDASTSTSTAATVSHSYAAAGTYTVKLTATDTNGVTETMTRNNYIIAYEKPIPAFSANPPTGTAPLTVNFTNLSVNAFYYRWNFIYPFSSGLPFSNETNPSFTFTNAGSYPVRLTAYNEGGNVSITNTIIVNP